MRGGRVRAAGWVLEKVEDVTTAGLVEHFLGQVYGDTPDDAEAVTGPVRDGVRPTTSAPDTNGLPREVLVPELPPDAGR